MLSNPWMRLAVVAGAVYAAYRYAPNGVVKSAAVAVGAIVAAKQIPIVKEYV